MFSPQWAVIKTCIHYGAGVSILKTSHPFSESPPKQVRHFDEKRPMDTIRARSPVRALVCANEQKAAAAQSQTDSHKLLRCARIPRPFVTDHQRRERRRFDDSRVTGYITIDGYKIDSPGVTCQ